jgi:hypothetical protein
MLKPESEVRKLWEKAPFAVTFKVYIFNVTNPDVVVRGGKVSLFLHQNFAFPIALIKSDAEKVEIRFLTR